MATRKVNFANSASITCTLASLANNAARECTAVDNGTNLYIDVKLTIACKLQSGSPANEKAIYVWFYGSEDGTNYTDNATGSDAAVTMRSPSNLLGPFTISAPDSGALTYKATIDVARFFDGVMPRKWGFVVENKTNIAFDATEGNHIKTYTGVYETVA